MTKTLKSVNKGKKSILFIKSEESNKKMGKKTKKVSFTLDKIGSIRKGKDTSNKTKKEKSVKVNKSRKGKKEKLVKLVVKNKKGKVVKRVVVNPLCDTCLTVEHNKAGSMFSRNEENWKDFPYHLPILGRKTGDQSVEVNLGKRYKNRLIYYFATRPSKMQITKQFPDSYRNSNNNGLMLLDNEGKCKVNMNCPLHYKDVPPKGIKSDEKQGYATHLHILVSDSKMGKWEDDMFTQSVLCKIDKYQYNYHKVKGNRVIINAIDKKYSLPGTYGSIDYQRAKVMTPSQLRSKVQKVINNKLGPKCFNLLDVNNVIDMPLLVYCHNPECGAAKELVTSLYKAGFYNILYYPGGFLDYYNREK